MLTISFSGKSRPSALKLAGVSNAVELVRRSGPHVDVNWGRNVANSTLNPDISNVTNKRVMRQLFKEHGVPTPTFYTMDEVWDKLANEVNVHLIGRPDRHSKGRGFWHVRGAFSLRKAMDGTRKKKAATHFMEYIDAEREYRVHVFKGKSIRISRKEKLPDGTWLARKPGEIKLRRVREAAKSAVESLGLDFGAVDVLASGDENQEVWVTEVNAAPGLGGSMPQLYVDTFNRWKGGEWEEE